MGYQVQQLSAGPNGVVGADPGGCGGGDGGGGEGDGGGEGGGGNGGGDEGGGSQVFVKPVSPEEAGADSVADAIVAVSRPLPLRSALLSPNQMPHGLVLQRSPDAMRAAVCVAVMALS